MKLKPIREQVVVVVGANSGIGRETALQFAQKGAQVVLSGRDQTALDLLADEITRGGGRATAIAADVTDFQQMKRLADRTAELHGRIDTWVHLAAVMMYATFMDTTPEEFRHVIEVNLVGQAYGAMAALPHLRREGRGALIHVSSVEAHRSLPYQSAYAASKHGIPGFLDSLRLELEHEGLPISVANIIPASINTPLFDKALTRMGVKPRPVYPVYEPVAAVDAILYAAEHPARDVMVGSAAKQFKLLQRFSPRLGDKVTAAIGFRGQKTTQPKSANAPHNLHKHLPGYDTAKGSFSGEARPSLYTWMQDRPLAKAGLALGALAFGAWVSTRVISNQRESKKLTNRVSRFVSHQLPKFSREVKKRYEKIELRLPKRLAARQEPHVLKKQYEKVESALKQRLNA